MQQDITFQTHWLKKYILSFNTKVKHLSAIASLLFSLCEQSTSVVALPFHQQWWFHQILIYTTRECLLSIYGKIVIERFFFFISICQSVFSNSKFSLLKNGVTIHFNCFQFPISENAFCYFLLKLTKWFYYKCHNIKKGLTYRRSYM